MIKVPKLKMALWQEILYLVFVAIIPIVLTVIELFEVKSSMFSFSFASVGSLLITIIVIRKFVINSYLKKLQERILMLEHDYETGNGVPTQIESRWAKFSAIIYGYSALVTLLSLVLFTMFVAAITSQLLSFKGASILILSSVIIGLLFKTALYVQRILKKNE